MHAGTDSGSCGLPFKMRLEPFTLTSNIADGETRERFLRGVDRRLWRSRESQDSSLSLLL